MPVLTGGVQIPEYPGDHFHYVFSKILMAGRANGLQVIDGPFLKIRELDALRDYSMRCRILGFDGKWALHPDQVKVINEVFTPTQEQFDRAFDILEAYEKATTEGDRKGAVMFGDEMIDEASRKMANKFVTRGERGGHGPLRRVSRYAASKKPSAASTATTSLTSSAINASTSRSSCLATISRPLMHSRTSDRDLLPPRRTSPRRRLLRARYFRRPWPQRSRRRRASPRSMDGSRVLNQSTTSARRRGRRSCAGRV